MKCRVFLQFGVAWMALCGSVKAASNTKWAEINAQLDVNNDGKLSMPEIMLGLAHLRGHKEANLISAKAKGVVPAKIVEDGTIETRYLIFRTTHQMSLPCALDAINPEEFGLGRTYVPARSDREVALARYERKWDLKIRRSSAELKKPLDDPYDQGAIFSFGRDFQTSANTYTARGVVGLTYLIAENPLYDPYYDARQAKSSHVPPKPINVNCLESLSAALKFEFDQMKSTDPKAKGTDSLAVGLQVSARLRPFPDFAQKQQDAWDAATKVGGKPEPTQASYPFWKSVDVDASLKWVTDRNFRRSIPTFELGIAPYFDLPGHGNFRTVGNPEAPFASFRWSATLHLEAGSVEDPGSSPRELASTTFARTGIKADLEWKLFPRALGNRLGGTVSYLRYWALTRETKAADTFSAGLQWALLAPGPILEETKTGALAYRNILPTIRIEYQHGRLPVTMERDRSLVLGLGIYY